MRRCVSLVSVLLLALVGSAASAAPARRTFMPENDLGLEDAFFAGGITEAQFNAVVAAAERVYKPLIKANFGAKLVVEKRWSDSTVNAYADQSGTTWQVTMFGGLARRPEVTVDAFAMVLCHEIGHHIAGYPFVGSRDWAANEGQSDVFANGACAAKVLAASVGEAGELVGGGDEAGEEAAAAIPERLRAACDAANDTAAKRAVCYRSIAAGKSLGDLLGALNGERVSYDTPDKHVVSRTDNEHPAAQCRLDTYVASALCGASRWTDTLIPGKRFSNRNSRDAQNEAFAHSCTTGAAARPRCWFASVRIAE